MKKIVVVIVLIVACVATYFYVRNRIIISELNEKLQEAIGRDQGFTEMILRIPNETITYGEVFDLCEKSIEKRNELLIQLRGVYPNIHNKLKDTLSDFLSVENEIVRLRSIITRNELKLKSKKEYIDQLKESADNSYYYSNFYEKEIKSEFSEAVKIASDMVAEEEILKRNTIPLSQKR